MLIIGVMERYTADGHLIERGWLARKDGEHACDAFNEDYEAALALAMVPTVAATRDDKVNKLLVDTARAFRLPTGNVIVDGDYPAHWLNGN